MATNKSKIVEANGKKLALALDWNTIPGVKQADEIAALSKEVGSTHYAKSRADTEGGILVGFLSSDAITKGKIYSAAQSFASMPGIEQRSIMVWDLDDGEHTWVCQVINGAPVVGMDLVVTKERANTIVNDQVSFSTSGRITIYGNSEYHKSSLPVTLDDIADACGKDDEIRKVSNVNISPFALTISLCVLSTIAYGGYYYMEQQRIAEARRAQMEAQKVDPNVQYAELLKTAQTGIPAGSSWSTLKHNIDNIEVYANGWKFKKIECDMTSLCTMNWERVNGSNSDLISVLNLPEDTKWETDGAKVSYTMPLPEFQGDKKVDLNTLPTMKSFFAHFMSDVQNASLVGLNTQMKNVDPYSLPPGVAIGDIKRESIVNSGEWTVSGDYWMNEFIQTMPRNFSLKTVRVEFQGDKITFEAKGNYYAKN